MARRSQISEKRRELLPVVARAFTELGYRRTTTAELAARCSVRENILYRLWPDKKAMFIAAIEYVYDFSEKTWLKLLEAQRGAGTTAERLLQFESQHHGEFGHYRILFTALGETDDGDIRAALHRVYGRFHRFLVGHIIAHRKSGKTSQRREGRAPSAELAAWAVIGLGTAANIGREVGLLSGDERTRLLHGMGRTLLEGGAA